MCSQTNICNFSNNSNLTWNYWEISCPFPKAMQAEVGQLGVDFREITTAANIWTNFVPVGEIPPEIYMQTEAQENLSGCPSMPSLHLKILWERHLEIPLTDCLQNLKVWISAPFIDHWFSCVSTEIPLIEYLIAWTMGLILGAHIHHYLLKWEWFNELWKYLSARLLEYKTS